MLVSWIFVVLAFMGGGFFGIVLAALISSGYPRVEEEPVKKEEKTKWQR